MIRLFRVLVPVGTVALLLSEALLVSAAFVLATYYAIDSDPTYYLLHDSGWISILVVLVSIVMGLYFQDLYTDIYVKSRAVLLQQLIVAIGGAFLTLAFLSYLDRGLRMPLHILLPGSLLAAVTMYGWRLFFTAYAIRVVGRDRLLLLGSSPLLTDISRYILEHPEQGLQITGYVDDSYEINTPLPGGKILGHIADVHSVVNACNPTRIVVGMSERRSRAPMNDLLELRFAGHIIEEVATTYERVCGRIAIRELRPSQLIYSGELGPRRQTLIFQSVANLLVAAAGTIISLPLMLLTALMVRLSSPGPILYRQTRVGLNGSLFTVYKFRSMRQDAEAATGAVWASKDDPRVTAVGRLIRKIRFDELPQLFNVLKGEMAIVGPRPERPEFVKTLSEQIPYYRQRHCVLPGITGWAQISYKYGDTIEDTMTKLEYDLYYIKNMSLSMDTYIIFHTMKAMLLSRGAQ